MFLDDTYTSKSWETSEGKIASGGSMGNKNSQPAGKKGPCEKKIFAKNEEKKKFNKDLSIPMSS